jgi:hypothetical protein
MTHNRDELKEKMTTAIAEFWGENDHPADAAEACLSAIEQSGCTICPNEPTDEQLESAADIGGASAAYWSMLSVSPFKKRGEKPA